MREELAALHELEEQIEVIVILEEGVSERRRKDGKTLLGKEEVR
jgi:hypothetical protein